MTYTPPPQCCGRDMRHSWRASDPFASWVCGHCNRWRPCGDALKPQPSPSDPDLATVETEDKTAAGNGRSRLMEPYAEPEPIAPGRLWIDDPAETPPAAIRIHCLETALAALLERVERTGGYATPEDQDTLQAAKQALAGGGGHAMYAYPEHPIRWIWPPNWDRPPSVTAEDLARMEASMEALATDAAARPPQLPQDDVSRPGSPEAAVLVCALAWARADAALQQALSRSEALQLGGAWDLTHTALRIAARALLDTQEEPHVSRP